MRRINLILGILLSCYCSWGQIGINTTSFDGSAIFEISSTNSGVIFPRMDTTARDLIIDPANGLIIFNTSSNTLEYNQGTSGSPIWTVVASQATVSSYNTQSIKYSNTDVATNVNVNGGITLPIFGTEEWNDNTSLFSLSGNTLTVTEAGRYKLNVNVSLGTTVNTVRQAPEIFLEVNGTQRGTYGSTGYKRATGSGITHPVSSLHINQAIDLNAGAILTIEIARTANPGNMFMRSPGSSNFYLEKID